MSRIKIANKSREFELWREKARDRLLRGVVPVRGDWDTSQANLFESSPRRRPPQRVIVPAEFLKMAPVVACARDEDRWDLLYRVLYRLNHENFNLLKVSVDDDIRRMNLLFKSVRRDIHKMHAFVRFKKTEINGVEAYVAWHKPEHIIHEIGTPFFARRFGDKPWSIFTPDGSAHWNLEVLSFGPGMSQNDFAHEDPFDTVWKTYYKSIFNPARVKIKAMKAEMSPKYWSTLPEAEIIRELIRETPRRLQDMASTPVHLAQPPRTESWPELRAAALKCRACPLGALASQTVFGEGNIKASLMIVGEQPGDLEDVLGKPFVGPSGDILNMALMEVGIEREDLYVTKAVKHFKFTAENGKRLHKTASGSEMHACKPWLEHEIELVQPKVILCLGAKAGTAVYGRLVKIQSERQTLYRQSGFADVLLMSWHPSAILRTTSEEEKNLRFRELVEDLQLAFALSQDVPTESHPIPDPQRP